MKSKTLSLSALNKNLKAPDNDRNFFSLLLIILQDIINELIVISKFGGSP